MNDNSSKNEPVRNGDVQNPITALGEATLAVDLARADLDQAIATAHRYPRILDTVIKQISTMALYNEDAAENCIYALPRASKPIVGPSIGFANIVASAWGNCRDGARIVYIDRKEKTVNAEGAFLDLQSNRQIIVPVNRRIVDKNGRIYSDDMIMVTGMAAASIARRNAILNAVPRALWHPIYDSALGIVRGTVGTFAERKGKAIKAFGQFGVKPEQLFMALGLKGDVDLTFEHLPSLLGMYTQLRDGAMTVEEMFDPRRMTGRGFETVDNPLADAGDEGEGGMDPATGEVAAEAQPGTTAQAASAQPAETQAQGAPSASQAPASAGATDAGATAKPTTKAAAKAAAAAEPAKEPAKPDLPAAWLDPNDKTLWSGQYVEHALNWLDAADERNWPAINIDETWKGERKLREACNVVENDFDTVNKKFREVLSTAKKREAAAAKG